MQNWMNFIYWILILFDLLPRTLNSAEYEIFQIHFWISILKHKTSRFKWDLKSLFFRPWFLYTNIIYNQKKSCSTHTFNFFALLLFISSGKTFLMAQIKAEELNLWTCQIRKVMICFVFQVQFTHNLIIVVSMLITVNLMRTK